MNKFVTNIESEQLFLHQINKNLIQMEKICNFNFVIINTRFMKVVHVIGSLAI